MDVAELIEVCRAGKLANLWVVAKQKEQISKMAGFWVSCLLVCLSVFLLLVCLLAFFLFSLFPCFLVSLSVCLSACVSVCLSVCLFVRCAGCGHGR